MDFTDKKSLVEPSADKDEPDNKDLTSPPEPVVDTPEPPAAEEPEPAPAPAPTPPPVAAAPIAPAPATPPQQPHQPQTHVNAGLVVLQWLTYAFWGWTVLALSVLTSLVISSLLIDDATDLAGGASYGIAAVLVLLPISFVCDFFYSKREPAHKTGAETLVMVIHAVLFALFGIGSLIVGVFSIVSLLTSSNDMKGVITTLLCSFIIAVYYGLTFLRTLNPSKMPWIKRYYKFAMLISVGLIIVLAIVGPVAKERELRDDRLIESSLSDLKYAIDDYASANKKLPANLETLELRNDDAKQLVKRKLVEFKPETSETTYDLTKNAGSAKTASEYQIPTTQTFRYQLCVTYKQKHGDSSSYKYRAVENDDYATYLSDYDHPAGYHCYKLATNGY